MSAQTELLLKTNCRLAPAALYGVETRVPLDAAGDIPLMVKEAVATLVTPTLSLPREGALGFALDEPFGFVQEGHRHELCRTQKATAVVLEQAVNARKLGQWLAIITTPRPLERDDRYAFRAGLDLYALFALHRFRAQHLAKI